MGATWGGDKDPRKDPPIRITANTKSFRKAMRRADRQVRWARVRWTINRWIEDAMDRLAADGHRPALLGLGLALAAATIVLIIWGAVR